MYVQKAVQVQFIKKIRSEDENEMRKRGGEGSRRVEWEISVRFFFSLLLLYVDFELFDSAVDFNEQGDDLMDFELFKAGKRVDCEMEKVLVDPS